MWIKEKGTFACLLADSKYPIQYEDTSNISSSLQIHREIESLKHAFPVRMNLGDPDFVDVKKALPDVQSHEFAAELKKTIYDNMTFDSNYYDGR